MDEAKFVEMVTDAKVMAVGGGQVTLAFGGEDKLFELPVTREMEQRAGRNLYRWVRLRVTMGSTMEDKPFEDAPSVPAVPGPSP